MSGKRRSFSDGKNASIGIGAMIVFIAMVLIAGIAASVLVQTAGKLERRGMESGAETTAEVSTAIKITDIEGKYWNRSMGYNSTTNLHWNVSGRDDGTPVGGSGTRYKYFHNYSRIHNITFTVTPRAGSDDVDLSQMLLEISNSTHKNVLTYDSSQFKSTYSEDGIFSTGSFDLGPNEFGVIVIYDADGSCSSSTPVINRGDYAMLTVNCSVCFFGLEERDKVWGTIMPEEGSSSPYTFIIPASMADTVYDLF